METILTTLASSALDALTKQKRLQIFNQAVELCREDHGISLAQESGKVARSQGNGND